MIYVYPNPKQMLSWMPKWMLNTVPHLPEIIHIEDPSDITSGGYCPPSWGEKRGVILLVNDTPHQEATLAHEFRHHWQWFNTWTEPNKFNYKRFDHDYWGAIVDYYKQPAELDALRFECMVAPNDINLKTYDHVMRNW